MGFLDALMWFSLDAVLALYVASMLIAMVRLVKGPSLPDRVIALDFIVVCLIGFIAVDAISSGEAYYLRAAVVLALVGFVGTLAFAYYAQKELER